MSPKLLRASTCYIYKFSGNYFVVEFEDQASTTLRTYGARYCFRQIGDVYYPFFVLNDYEVEDCIGEAFLEDLIS